MQLTRWVLILLSLSLWTKWSSVNASTRVHGLPDGPLIAGYVTQCDSSVVTAVLNGVNVIYWFALSLTQDEHGAATITYSGPALSCIGNVSSYLSKSGYSLSHMVSVGGWNAPHPPSTLSASHSFAAFHKWNEQIVATQTNFALPHGFDGIDWDLEGNDDTNNSENFFSVQLLHFIGEFSQAARRVGYVVSMVPAESYLDPTTSQFDQSLLHAYPEWQPQFQYHGHNLYAFLLANYGITRFDRIQHDDDDGGGEVRDESMSVSEGEGDGADDGMKECDAATLQVMMSERDSECEYVDTFEVVLIQLYETYSHLAYNMTQRNQSASDYLVNWVPRVLDGWYVDFASDPNITLASQNVRVKPNQLLLGFGNAWTAANTPKTVLVMPQEIGVAHQELASRGRHVRGYFVWVTSEEGNVPAGGTEPLFFFRGLNDFLHVRP